MARISISASQNLGKTTVVRDFLKEWPLYTTPQSTYRDILKEKKLKNNQQTTEETQQIILDWMIKEQNKHRPGDRVIYDRCVIDNLVYTLWCNEKGKISDEFVKKTIAQVRQALTKIDIIFFIPITKFNNIDLTVKNDNPLRDEDLKFREEIDWIFKSLCAEWQKEESPFFISDDRPPIIEIFGSPKERIEIIKLYLDKDGDEIKEGNIIDPNELAKLADTLGLKPGENIIDSIRGKESPLTSNTLIIPK